MARHIIIRAFLALVLALPSLAAHAESIVLPIEITKAYAYATAPVQKNGAVFMHVTNNSTKTDKLTAASADVAAKTELHTHIMDGDMMQMREVESYDLPADKTTILEPAGHHIMLMGLNAPLKAGETFPLTLSFERNTPLTIDVTIKNPGDLE